MTCTILIDPLSRVSTPLVNLRTTMDSLDGFTFLTINLPIWSEKLNQLSLQVAERHSEFLRLSQTPSLGSARKRKTGSTESLRPNDTLDNDRVHTTVPVSPSSPLRIEIDPDNRHLFREVREARRRRKPTSLLSSSSGPPKFRARMSLIVYYDSAIQEGFEILVRNIAIARNNLRKSKAIAGFKIRSSTLETERNQDTAGGNSDIPSPTSTRSGDTSGSRLQTQESTLTAFDVIDKELEAAQSLCEVGAHQFLREGNCSEEVEGTKERFENCIKMAEQQVLILKSEDQREQERQEQKKRDRELQKQRERNAQKKQEEEEKVMITPLSESTTISVDAPAVKLKEKRGSQMSFPAIDAIEVDDDSDASSIHIDLSAFRSARRAYKAN